MYVLLFLVILIVIYIRSFKDNFKPENLEKVTPVIAVAVTVVIAFFVLSIALGGI